MLEYSLNQRFIAATYCVNKAKPELKCEGKCFLKMRIAQEEGSSENSPSQVRTLDETPHSTFDISSWKAIYSTTQPYIIPVENLIPQIYTTLIWSPPWA